MNFLTLVVSLLLLSGMAVASEKMSFERQLTAPALDFETVEIITGAGTLRVIGGSGEEMTVDATVTSADYSKMAEFVDEFESKMLFYIKQQQGMIQIMAKPRKSMFNTPNIQINLLVTLPSQVNLNVDDGSGSLMIENISGRLNVDDESGSLRINNIRNDISIKDGAGSITITDIDGLVNIEDKAGAINMSDINGNVVIKDRSGSIEAEKITGNLTLDDTSGDVTVKGLSGQFILLDDGSGKLQVNGKAWPKK